jgi:hypothetical protein
MNGGRLCFLANKYQMAEYRISIYGRRLAEWDTLASWVWLFAHEFLDVFSASSFSASSSSSSTGSVCSQTGSVCSHMKKRVKVFRAKAKAKSMDQSQARIWVGTV